MKNNFYDDVLIKLKRAYSKDETVSALIKKLSETEVVLGQRNDEIDELKEKVKELQSLLFNREQSLNHHKKVQLTINNGIKESVLYKNLLNRNKKLDDTLNRLRKDNWNLISENIKLKSK